ncbi:5-formyltetrahydrofolate cyclo-ligase [Campylobacter suis]|uniref:5-formyltetrahydrofolate cyclo-ligase n=1 Tax=Campylobacter suis TaxID=2790657 RepID=UPI001E44AA7E|nr:5-formyltetrahydrofolate cyclo-ligase [Campylobacter suis]
MSVKSTKDEFRAYTIKNTRKRAKISAKCRSQNVIKRLSNLIKFTNSKKILLYMPLFYEVDVYKMRRFLSNRDIFVPFMVDISLKMVKLRLPFELKKFNLREPLASKFANDRIDMAVVPCNGVDGAMRRIGHGKGFYDRFFSDLPYRPRLIVFVQAADFYTDKILSKEHDICGDIYLTPNKNYIKRGNYDRSFSRLRSRCGGSWRRLSVCKKDKRCKL